MSDDRTAIIEPAPEAVAEPTRNGENYEAENIDILRDAEHIRHRPGMYIGDTGVKGMHHLVYELVHNSVDEALAGYCKQITIKINVDGSVSVADDGRGIPVEMHPKANKPTLEVVLTMSGAGGKFDKRSYKTSAGLHGIGAKAVTALSEWTEAEVRRNGKVYQQEYERGKAVTELKEIGSANNRTGTKVTFKPDPEIFHDAAFDYDTLETRLRELAFLNKGLAIKLTDERTGKEETFHYEIGVAEFVEYINRSEETLHKPIYIDKAVDDVRVELALQYTAGGEEERVRCYTNNAYNAGGGTHLSGFRAALTRTLNAYGSKQELFKNGLAPIGEDFREGLTAVISIQVPEPQFESQTKIRLNNPEVEGIVTSVVNEQLGKFLEENPKEAQKIMKKVVTAAEAREAAAKARKALKDRKNILNSGGLPGKLYDCTGRDRDESELFLVEGQSAGGTAESGRDRMFQAILPLRGKVLNVEKARMEKVLSNEELCNLISAIGVDIGVEADLTKRRYGKVVLLTDADVDGQHIRTLLLTFFYRQMQKLIEEGFIYVARPPLFKVTHKKDVRFVQTTEEIDTELNERGLKSSKLQVLPPPAAATPAPVVIDGEALGRLLQTLTDVENSVVILERRGITLTTLLDESKAGVLPEYRVRLAGEQRLLAKAEMDKFRHDTEAKLGHELVVGDELNSAGQTNGHARETIFVTELHEVRAIKAGIERLTALGLTGRDLVPQPRVAGREPPPRFVLENGDSRKVLAHLRELPLEIRRLGERGLSIMRFKGLGEMDAEELWETTLDPAKRTLMRVQLEDALQAEEMFRTLMGEKVEPRRDFIQKHALEVKDIDYHGA
jgi:DNA gyrase subunit B